MARTRVHTQSCVSKFPPGFPLRGRPRDVLRQLLGNATPEPRELDAAIDGYVARVRARAAEEEFVDVALAERLAAAAHGIVAAVSGETPQEVRQIAYAAVQYFVLEQDAENDLSPIGFDDDREVMNAVAQMLGRDDLRVEAA